MKRTEARARLKFKRNFGSRKRVNWIRGLPCAFCGGWYSVRNAHMRARGMGGAGGTFEEILPCCGVCDAEWARGRESFLVAHSLTWDDIDAKLAQVNAAWESMGSPSSTNSVAVRGRRPPGPLDAAAVSGANP